MPFLHKRLLFLGLCSCILIIGLFYQASNHPSKEAVQAVVDSNAALPGSAAPDAEVTGLNDQSYQLRSFFGKPVLLTFFTTWCEICQEEIPALSNYYEKNSDQLRVIAVNATSQETSIQDVKNFASQGQLKMPVLLDDSGEAMDAYQITGVPISYLIDEDGAVVRTFYGKIDPQEIDGLLDQ
ncbi:TlpA family protein disulfide reductase [Alteribacillus sp. HJP-4]|uniref:TlpA family protein disulfide reductase n=1 Tax=Alteribacillus sp. HJP-4 TaxID=2775394 RepID=UPI0035CCF234